MKLFALALGSLLVAISPAQAAGSKDMEASMQQMQEAQAKMMQAMMIEKQSKMSFNDTVDALKKAAEARGWKVTGVLDAQEAMKKAGHKEARPMKVVGMCHPGLAEAVLKAQQQAKQPPALTCRYSVFESPDGKTYVMRFNTSLMAEGAKGDVATALANLAREEDALMTAVLK
jgi:uncharacterized protein (DUF302 family)